MNVPLIIGLIVAVILWTVLNRTELGQRIKAVGGNRTAVAEIYNREQ